MRRNESVATRQYRTLSKRIVDRLAVDDKEAARIIARIKAGEAPIPVAPKADPTMAELAERYQREHVAMRCRPATVAHYADSLGAWLSETPEGRAR